MEGEEKESKGRNEGKVSGGQQIYASHLLVLSSMSSEKLQALPGEPLMVATSHKLSVFTMLPAPAHSSL